MLEWEKLLNSKRRKDVGKEDGGSKTAVGRLEIERDYDRILFSTPVRRLADKTQVFPLEINDSVRTRLTHSHEVSNLSRSIGVHLAFETDLIDRALYPERNIPSLLAAIGLAHDLGNPPFGHQGEFAIQSWFQDNGEAVLDDPELTEAMKQDFLKFEGNAQTLRLLTRLQVLNDNYGLNLTYATLAALMKYPTSADSIDKSSVARKKHGYFQSEEEIVKEIWEATGLSKGIRHPLTYVMETCDDIAYSVIDAEDSVKKGLVSFSDLISYLGHHAADNEAIGVLIEETSALYKGYRREASLSPAELNDISTQMFRVHAISLMVNDAKRSFIDNYDSIMTGTLSTDLLTDTASGDLYAILKKFDKEHAYRHKSVLEIELEGYEYIRGLMGFLWEAISGRESKKPFSSYGYGRISENYRRIFEQEDGMPTRYKELQLLTDMISGMTDSFVISLYKELKKYCEITTS